MCAWDKVSRQGDIMVGDLDMGGNTIFLREGANGGAIRGHDAAPYIQVRLLDDSDVGNLQVETISLLNDIDMLEPGLVDGFDPSKHAQPHGCLYLGTQQDNIPQVPTIIELDTVPATYTDGIETTGTHIITPDIAGFYAIVGQVSFKGPVVDKTYEVYISVNDTTIIVRDKRSISVAADFIVPVGAITYLDGDDYLQLEVSHADGVATVDIHDGLDQTFLKVIRLG